MARPVTRKSAGDAPGTADRRPGKQRYIFHIRLAVVKDEPGRSLELQGGLPAPRQRWGCLGLSLPLLLVGATLAWAVDFGWGLLLFGAVGTAIALLNLFERQVRSLVLDASSGHLAIEETVNAGYPRWSTRALLDEIEAIEVRTGVQDWEKEPVSIIALKVTLADGDRSFKLRIKDLDSQGEVMDLASRMAAIAGLRGCLVERSDPKERAVVFRRRPGDEFEEARWPTHPASYGPAAGETPARTLKGTERPAEPEEPPRRIPGFVKEIFRSPFRLLDWRPGTRVELRMPRQYGLMAGLVAASIPCGAIAAYGAWSSVHGSATGAPLAVVFGAPALLLAFCGLFLTAGKETIIDWERRALAVRFGRRLLDVPFDAIESLELRRESMSSRVAPGHRTSSYTHRVRALMGDGTLPADVELLYTDTTKSPEAAELDYQAVLPLAMDLAAALGVPCEYVEHHDRSD